MAMPPPPAIRAIRAWLKLEQARAAYNRDLKVRFGLQGLELAILRIVAERPEQKLIELRRSLQLHPATLGQALDRLAAAGLCGRESDPDDRRGWLISATKRGRSLAAQAPLAGPVRLRSARIPHAKLDRLASAFEESIAAFGLSPWVVPEAREGRRTDIADVVNIGPKLASDLRRAKIDTLERLKELGALEAWRRLRQVAPQWACGHSCLALAGAVEGVRWTSLPQATRRRIVSEAKSQLRIRNGGIRPCRKLPA